MIRKILAAFLSLCMLASLLPGTALAGAEETRGYNQFRVGYDMNRGSVYWSRGSSYPEGTDEDFLADGDWTSNVNQNNTVHFLIDKDRAVDRDAWNNGDFIPYRPDGAENSTVNVQVDYDTQEGWFRQTVVVNGTAVAEGFTFEDNVLSFKAEAALGEVYVNIWWSEDDLNFYTFEPGEGELLLQYEWNGPGWVELDPGVTVLDSLTQNEYNQENPEQLDHSRTRVLIPDDTASVTLTWEGHLRAFWVEGEGDENGWGEHLAPAGNAYTYQLNCTNDNGDPWNHYGISFEFYWGWDNQLNIGYDAGGGAVYAALGDQTPTVSADCYLNDNGWFSFAPEGEIQTVRLLFDQDHSAWVDNGTLWQEDSRIPEQDRELFVFANYTRADGEEVWDWVVEFGEAVMPGFTLEDNVLSFTPETGLQVNLDVRWCEADYDYQNFGPDENTVLIEFNAWGDGAVHWEDGVDVGSMVQPENCRGKILVPRDAETLTFTWEGHLRTLGVFGLTGEWEQTEWSEPAFASYTLELNQTNGDGSPSDHYWLNFDFASSNEWNFLYAVNYDDNGGSVFRYDDYPAEGEEGLYLPRQGSGREDWPDNVSYEVDGQPGTVYLRFDLEQGLNHEAWDAREEDFLQEAWHADDKTVYVVAKYAGLDGEWHEELLVENGQAACEEASFEDGLLIYQPESGYGVDFDVWWRSSDYTFSQFHGTEDKPVVVEASWWGGDAPILLDEIPEEDILYLDGAMKLRLPWTVENLTFTWHDYPGLRYINIEGLGDENGSWLNDYVPEGDTYVLELNQHWDNGDRRDRYNIQFCFEGSGMDDRGELRLGYDQNRGAVFSAFGAAEPEAAADCYLHSGPEGNRIYLNDNGDPQTIRLLIDETKAIDWEDWNEEHSISFRRADEIEDRSLYIYVRTQRMEGLVVADGSLTDLGQEKGFGFTRSDEIHQALLSYTPETTTDVEVNVFWSQEDYEFNNFWSTEERPVLVEVNWWGEGEPILLDDVAEEDVYYGSGRMKLRLPWSVESLTFTWEGSLESINIDGLGENGDWLNDYHPEGDSYVLLLNQYWIDGTEKNNYQIQFSFRGKPMGENGELWTLYDENRGAVFTLLDAFEPPANPNAYRYMWSDNNDKLQLFDEDDNPHTVLVMLDERKAIDWEQTNQSGEIVLRDADHVEDRSIYVVVHSNETDGLIVENYELTALGLEHGFEFTYSAENGCGWLVYTPSEHSDMEIKPYWCEEDYLFDSFNGTGEKPVCVQVEWQGSGTIQLPEGLDPEDVFCQEHRGRARIRVAEDVTELRFRWGEDEILREINVNGYAGYDDWYNNVPFDPDSNEYVLQLNAAWGNGDPRNWYHIQFYFEQPQFGSDGRIWVDYNHFDGAVFRAVGGGDPETELRDYQRSTRDSEGEDVSFGFLDEDGQPRQVALRFDPTQALDWGLWEDEHTLSLMPIPAMEDYCLYVVLNSSRFNGPVVEAGELSWLAETYGGDYDFYFADDTLRFTPPDDGDIQLYVYWRKADWDFDGFLYGKDGILVEAYWDENGCLYPPEALSEDAFCWQPEYSRLRVFLPWDTDLETLRFTWEAGCEVRCVRLDDQELYPEDGAFELDVTQSWEDGGRRNYYRLEFEFAPVPRQNHVSAFYEMDKGTVFWALDEEPFQEDEAHTAFGMNRICFAGVNGPRTVRLWFDGSRSARYGDDGSFFFEEAAQVENRAITVVLDGEFVLLNGAVTDLGQTLQCSFDAETGVLTFVPEQNRAYVFHTYWCYADYEYDSLMPTPEYPILVEVNWRNYGSIDYPENWEALQAEGRFAAQENRFRVLLPDGTESFPLTWGKWVGVQQIEYYKDWDEPTWVSIDQSQPHCFELPIEPIDPDSGMEDAIYTVNVDFFPDSRWQLWVSWAGSEGNVYYGLNEIPPADLEHYVWENPSYLVVDEDGNESIGTVYLRLDPEHSVEAFTEEITELWPLPAWEGYCPSVWVSYPYKDEADTWFDGWAVLDGVAQEGFTFEDNVLSFTPLNEQPIFVNVYWSRENLEFDEFGPTVEKPLIVEFTCWGRAPISLPADIPAEDVYIWHAAEHDYIKVRLPMDQQSLHLTWERLGLIARFDIAGAGPDGGGLSIRPNDRFCDLPLTQTDWFGEPWDYYQVDVFSFGWPENPFEDVPETAWYREAVLYATALHITAGTSETTFDPNAKTTRAQMVTFLWRAAGSPVMEGVENRFTDVPETAWYRDAVLWAVETGITTGTSETTFSPNKLCTRAQAVTFLWRANGSPVPTLESCAFLDVAPNSYYRQAVLWAVEVGITAGTSDTAFSPNSSCTRAQAVTFIFRDFLNAYAGVYDWD